MSAEYIFALILGHFFSDYLAQNNWMARNKGNNNFKGYLACSVHALIYSLTVIVFTWDFRFSWFLVVLISHWPIDKWSLANYWKKAIGGSTLKDFIYHGHEGIPKLSKLNVPQYKANYMYLMGGFAALVYAVSDNTLHMILMWIGWHLLNHLGW